MNTGESDAYRIGFGTGPIVFCGEQEIRNLIVEIRTVWWNESIDFSKSRNYFPDFQSWADWESLGKLTLFSVIFSLSIPLACIKICGIDSMLDEQQKPNTFTKVSQLYGWLYLTDKSHPILLVQMRRTGKRLVIDYKSMIKTIVLPEIYLFPHDKCV